MRCPGCRHVAPFIGQVHRDVSSPYLCKSRSSFLKRKSTSSAPSFAELARVALVTATWPILLANSIAGCLWNTPIENISQSPSCTTLDLGGVDYTPLYNACGPPQVRSDYCCSVLQATYTQLYATWTNATGLQDNEVSSFSRARFAGSDESPQRL